jgi:hypothetical protein
VRNEYPDVIEEIGTPSEIPRGQLVAASRSDSQRAIYTEEIVRE